MTLKTTLVPFLFGVGGALVGVLLWTLYVDHQRVTAMWQVMSRPMPAPVAMTDKIDAADSVQKENK